MSARSGPGRRVRRLVVGLLAGVLLFPAGCGIPAETDVQVDGSVPVAEPGSLNGPPASPPAPTDSDEPVPFIENYLRAAAAGERDQAYARARTFLAGEARNQLPGKPQTSEIELTVVRLRAKESTPLNNEGTSTVRLKVQQIGVLGADGTLGPPEATETEYVFELRRAEPPGSGLLITRLPNVLLTSDSALREFYRQHKVYFWNSDQTRLVPDLRYLPAVPAERLVTEVVKWLAGGPSDWLRPGVTGLPDRTRPINNATGGNSQWEVNLDMPGANEERLARLGTQLAWSLPGLTGQLDLKIQNQKRFSVDLARERTEHDAYPRGVDPTRFSVYDGVIHPLALASERRGSVPLLATENRNVVSASIAHADEQVLAAMVVTGPDRRLRLKVGTGLDPVAVFNSNAATFGTMSRPTWLRSLDGAHPAGLVAADGKLYRFDGAAGLSPVPLNVAGKVVAVAGSLDGHRITLVSGGAVYVAPVNVDGGVVSLGQPRRLPTVLTGVTAADWISEDQLVLAGNDPDRRPVIHQVSVDGVFDSPLKNDIGSAVVTQLAGYPGSGDRGLPAFSFMYEANGAAYQNNPFGFIKRQQVLDLPAGSRVVNPTAPFFLY
ncbi:LpqB family beta-propeller domain-containing protein [Micromonospora humi]|uniref:Lipoprotein LpqB beta-propeller domain-containing protein n=1 Tax=Micromonospora humi TaxID=745366 RepID=A0A1C5HUV0_9ACTN|nr:LpqB family beta-propeller domain-containing protein [Micromonospora humi]SCG49742.1 Lipoprotein LpqB beta-propeller domain-containing protein [Micromonospora humi]